MKTPLRTIYGYAIGDGAFSLSMNGIANFALLYYTQVLGLGPKYAGLALSITIVWDAVSDPVMGYLTDGTRSRFGRRHPYILIGGLLLALSFFFLWIVPEGFTEPVQLFWYLLAMNMLVRTAVTVFIVPYAALGFEICTDYDERSKLQSVRILFRQIVNFSGGALAWSLFFRDGEAADGTRIDGTKVVENFLNMGTWLTVGIAVFIIACVYFTRGYAKSNREEALSRGGLISFLKGFKEIIADKYAIYVFSSKFIIQVGGMLTAQIQMFTYVEFMQFSHTEKTIAHGAGMLTFAVGSLFHAWLIKRIDKKSTALIGIGISVFGNLMLYVLFIGGILSPQFSWSVPDSLLLLGGFEIPVSLCAFTLFQGLWWGGIGMLTPLMLSMVADVSEINYVNTGKSRDGSFAAIFSFFMKAAMGVGMLVNGWLLEIAGYESGAEIQDPSAIRNIAIVTFVAGPCALIAVIPIFRKYPVDRKFMQMIKRKRVEMEPTD